ncbi:MAG: hypothetical protein ACI8PZ_006693, partial [Myxococcota bacterium]
MTFGLAAPLALLTAGLVALPVLAHLARQTPRERRAFGAMLLLERVVKRLRRRRRVKDPLLLLLRVLAGLAIALAVSGPKVSYPGGVPEFGGSGRVVIVVDRSMSMQLVDGGGTLLQRARTSARSALAGLPASALVGLVTFDGNADRLTSTLVEDHGRIDTLLESIQPSGGTSNLRAGLIEARRLLGGEPGEVLLFTDEAGPRIVTEARGEIENLVRIGSTIVPFVVQGDPPRNVAITRANYGDGLEGGQVTIRLANYGPDPIEVSCEVLLPDGAAIPIFVDIPPLGEAEDRVTVPAEAEGGVGEVACDDPDLSADDRRFFHLPRVGASRVLVIDGDPGDTPTRSEVYFLERALAPWGGVRTGLTLDVASPLGMSDLDPERHRVVFLANVSDPRGFGPRLTDFVRRGGNVVISGGDNVTADRYNAALSAILPAAFRAPRSLADRDEAGVPLALPDVSLALFEPFSRSGRAGFQRIRADRVMTLEPYEETDEVTTLLRWESGLPAMVERRIGQGRVIVWTGTFDLGWGNLPLQATFMPLMQRLVGYLGADSGGAGLRLTSVVGEPVMVPLPEIVIEPTVIGPEGAPVRSRIEGRRLLFTPDGPGAYSIVVDDAPALAWVAVNTDPIESDVRPYEAVARVERDLNPDL